MKTVNCEECPVAEWCQAEEEALTREEHVLFDADGLILTSMREAKAYRDFTPGLLLRVNKYYSELEAGREQDDAQASATFLGKLKQEGLPEHTIWRALQARQHMVNYAIITGRTDDYHQRIQQLDELAAARFEESCTSGPFATRRESGQPVRACGSLAISDELRASSARPVTGDEVDAMLVEQHVESLKQILREQRRQAATIGRFILPVGEVVFASAAITGALDSVTEFLQSNNQEGLSSLSLMLFAGSASYMSGALRRYLKQYRS